MEFSTFLILQFSLDRQRERKETGTQMDQTHWRQSKGGAKKNGAVVGRQEVSNWPHCEIPRFYDVVVLNYGM